MYFRPCTDFLQQDCDNFDWNFDGSNAHRCWN